MAEDANSKMGISPKISATVVNMSSAAEARDLFLEIAGPVQGSAWVTRAIEKVAAATGLSHRRLRGVWNNEIKRMSAEEIDLLRKVAKTERAIADARYFEGIANRLAAVESRLAQIDPTFFCEEIRRLGDVAQRTLRLSDGGK